jgi:NADH-quinone oxidoreductase subunit F
MPEVRRLLARAGVVDPESLEAYRSLGGYEALARATERGPAWVLSELEASGLLGRGGAAFPAGRKWRAVAEAAGRRRVVCNADESEPGTFKDRVLMEEDPFAVVEAMTIAGLTVAAEDGLVYVRGEYRLAAARLRRAIDQAERAGLLGADVAGTGRAFRIRVVRGAGAYICGEETALFNSVEGRRGEPRNKPPFPTQAGLFGDPTLVNNVETLCNVPIVVLEGASGFRRYGTDRSTGTKLFCVSGHVERPELYEVPFGTTLGELLALAGGVWRGRRLQAVLCGGAAGTFLGPDRLDLPLTFEGLRPVGGTVGSGAVIVLDETASLWDVVLRVARFFQEESCGQCVPCRIGTQRQLEIVTRLASGRARPEDPQLLADIGAAMTDASICGLGQTAAGAVLSALALRPGASSSSNGGTSAAHGRPGEIV